MVPQSVFGFESRFHICFTVFQADTQLLILDTQHFAVDLQFLLPANEVTGR